MFNGKIDLKQVSPNNEWKYLIRVILIIAVVLLVVYQLWFSWWVPSNQATPVKAESDKQTVDFIEIDAGTYVDKETGDVLKCNENVPQSCVHTDLNCSNIGNFDLWLVPDISRCLNVKDMVKQASPPKAIPTCIDGQRLWFVPETKQYFCK